MENIANLSLPAESSGGQKLFKQFSFDQNFPKRQKEIMNELISAALAEGIYQPSGFNGLSVPARDGSSADYVVFTTAESTFVTKFQQDKRIIEEAQFLKMLPSRTDLPRNFARHFPQVYQIKSDRPPFAYTMERFHMESFAEYLFKKTAPKEVMIASLEAILKILMPAYLKTKNINLRPSCREIYLGRIRQRLAEARALSADFNQLSRNSLTINGITYEPPEFYLDSIERTFKQFLVAFSTFVHGDCHPENILLDFPKDQRPVVKFIDPRGWFFGDYVFDLGKIAHYLFATGPAEKTGASPQAIISIAGCSLDYHLEPEKYHVPEMLRIINQKMMAFARQIGDPNWKQRYQLSLAANLLGTPVARLKSGKSDAINSALYYTEKVLSIWLNAVDDYIKDERVKDPDAHLTAH